MYYLNNIDGPLYYYEADALNEEGKVVVFSNEEEIAFFMTQCFCKGISRDFFRESLTVKVPKNYPYEIIYWEEALERGLFLRRE